MAERLNVLFLRHPVRAEMFTPWGEDVVHLIGDRHNLRIIDYSQPLAPQFEGVDVVIDHGGAAGTREMADIASGKIRLWQILGTGIDHFDLDYWRHKKIPVANTPGQFSAVALGECAMMLTLMLARKYPVTQANLRAGRFYDPLGIELEGLKLALIGFGASAKEFARRARPFGLQIMAIDIRDIGVDEIQDYGLAFTGKPDEIDRILPECDILSLHLHLTSATRHIIDERRLSLLKPTAFIINVARGELVDEAAMEKALVEGRLGGAAVDAYGEEPPDMSRPFFGLPNVIATPHISGVTNGTSRRRAQCCVDNVDRLAQGLDALYRVD